MNSIPASPKPFPGLSEKVIFLTGANSQLMLPAHISMAICQFLSEAINRVPTAKGFAGPVIF